MPVILDKQVSPVGYGLASLAGGPKIPSLDVALECLHTAATSGSLAWNAGEFYGTPEYNTLTILRAFREKYPDLADKVLLNIKGAIKNFMPIGTPEFVRESVDRYKEQLGPGWEIDMFETARRDRNVELGITMGTLKALAEEGKIRSVALSEVSAQTIQEAYEVVPVSSVEIEFSLWETGPMRNGILKTCKELEISVFA
jgi:pyridoxine 4-dehydrogenase